ncbi:hypothetical protein HaLaN_06522, partial [Haematococcus lacustris]
MCSEWPENARTASSNQSHQPYKKTAPAPHWAVRFTFDWRLFETNNYVSAAIMARHVVAPVRGMKYDITQPQSKDWAAPYGCGAWPWRGWRALCALPMRTAYACTLRTAYACTLRTAYA